MSRLTERHLITATAPVTHDLRAFLLSLCITIGIAAASVSILGWPYSGQQTTAAAKTQETTCMSNNPNASAAQLNESEMTAASARLQLAHKWYLGFGAAAALVGVAALFASYFIYTYSNTKSQIEQRFSMQKDRDFESYKLTVAAQVTDANERAASLEKEAEVARLEQERLKAAVTWRTLPPHVTDLLVALLVHRSGSVTIE